MAQVGSIRGLSQYIKKIRAASTQEEREAIVQKELAKIRGKYSSNKKCSAYDRKKYTWKLLYSHMMGYDVDFGHKQAADLIPSNNYDEKQVGYQALTILLNEEDEFMMLPVNNVLKDLTSRNELFVSLSLCFAGSVAGQEMSAAIAQPVVDAVMSPHLSEGCRKKAALCLLRVYRKLPEEAAIITADSWCERFQHLLTTARGTGMHLATTALLLGVLERDGPTGYEALQPTLVNNLAAVLTGHGQFGECLYYGIPSPWLQCKYLRALSYFPNRAHTSTYERLMASLSHILEQTVPAGKSNQNPAYARASVLTEAAAVCLQIEATPLLKVCLAKMTGLVERKDPNARYIALSSLCSLCASPDMVAALKPHLPQVVACLGDADPAVKKRAIDVLVAACDRSSVENVVSQLVRQLPLADADVRGELVVRVAILAERYAPSIEWYVTTMLALMDLGAEEVSDDVWQRAVHAVAGSEQDRSATTAAIARSLEEGSLSVPLINTAGYVLAEFADQVPDRTPADLAEELATRLPHMPVPTQGLLLTALIKLRMHAPEDRGLERLVTETFQQYSANANPDIQQRAVEYLELSYMADNPVVRDALFAPMPEWTEQRPLFPGSAAQDGSAEVSAAPAPTSPTGAVASDADSAAKGAAGSSTPAADEATAERSGASVGETEVVPTPAALLRNGDRDGAAAAPCAASASAASPAAEEDLLSLDSIVPPSTAGAASAAAAQPPATPAGLLDSVTATDPLAVLTTPPAAPFTNGTYPSPSAAATPAVVAFDPGVLSTTSSHVPSASGTGEAQLSTFNPSAQPPPAPLPPVPLDVPSVGMLTVPPVAPSPDKERMLYLGKGVLLEDAALQLGFVAAPPERSGSRVITLFAGNKREAIPLSEFAVSVAPSPAVPSAALGTVPPSLQPQEQLQLQLIVRGVASGAVPAPAPGGPAEAFATIAYTAPLEGRVVYRVELPLTAGSFAVPAESVSQASFFSTWGRLSGEGGGGALAAGMARLPAALPNGDVLAARMARLGFSDGGTRLDPTSPLNYAGQTMLAGGAAALTRVEVNPVDSTHINVTVVTERGAAEAQEMRQWIMGGLAFFALGSV